MTVSYNKDVTTTNFNLLQNNMIKLLFRWKGSVYRLIWDDCVVFLLIFAIFSVLYRFVLDPDGRVIFEYLVLHFNKFAKTLPLSWILGFYVGIVVNRWWSQFNTIPWPDNLAFRLNAAIKTNDVVSRMTRRSIIRYVNLGITIALLRMLDPAHNPYKTLDDLVEEGLLMDDEKKRFEEYRKQNEKPSKVGKTKKKMVFERSTEDCRPRSFEEFWIPLTWAISLIKIAGKDDIIKDPFVARAMIGEIISIRQMCTKLLCFDWINVPLVYTQVVTIAVYSFFIAQLLGSQFLEPNKYPQQTMIDFYVPLFTLLQFVFYIGWLKVAETLLNPFGGDDDDFEIVYLIKRNKEAGYAIVDDLVVPPPKLRKDVNWNEPVTEVEITNNDVRRSIRRKESVSLAGSQTNLDTIAESGESYKKKDEDDNDIKLQGIINKNIEIMDNIDELEKAQDKVVNINEKERPRLEHTTNMDYIDDDVDDKEKPHLDDISEKDSEGSAVTVSVEEQVKLLSSNEDHGATGQVNCGPKTFSTKV